MSNLITTLKNHPGHIYLLLTTKSGHELPIPIDINHIIGLHLQHNFSDSDFTISYTPENQKHLDPLNILFLTPTK